MTLKQLRQKAGNWWAGHNKSHARSVSIDKDGLICENDPVSQKQPQPVDTEAIVKKAGSMERKQNTEILGDAFNSLIGQLQGINDHLNKQIGQHEELMARIEKLPELLETLPDVVSSQRKLVDQLLEQLRARDFKDQHFADIVQKIPTETGKQTDVLVDMNRKLSVATDINAQMSDGFNRFNDTLGKLDTDTVSQTDGIMQMRKTFAASDRYLKFLISKQSRRFMWIFITATAVCVFAIIALVLCVVMVL